MGFLRSIADGLRRLLNRRGFEQELDDEVRHFSEMAAREHQRAGVSREEALRRARAEMGGVERVKEDARSGGWEFGLETFFRDVRYSMRSLRRNPAFTIAAVMTLAIGIGGNTTVFSLINAILLRPPAQVRAPEELVSIYTSDFSGPAYGTSSYPDFEEFSRQSQLFSGVTAVSIRPVGVGEGDDLQSVGMEMVSWQYFDVMGTSPAVGRFFAADEGRMGVPAPVVVIGHGLWQRRFAGDPSIVGRTIRLNGRPFTVIGVAPQGYQGSIRGLAIDVWVPMTAGSFFGDGPSDLAERGNRSYLVTARLAPGVAISQATAGMGALARNLFASYPDAWRDVSGAGRRVTLLSERDSRVPPQVRGPVIGFAAVLMGTLVLVLLVCCANVAGLMLARATRRSRELGVRLSLGASRGRVVRQLLTESALVAVSGGIAGAALALVATRAIATYQPPLPLRVSLDLTLDGRVLAFTLAIALVTGIVFGVFPALRASQARVTGMLKGEGGLATVGSRRISLQGILVSGQMAVSLLLLVGALLFLRSLRAASLIDPGFVTQNVLVFDVTARPDLQGPRNEPAVAEAIQRQVSGLPGVTRVTWGGFSPLGFGFARRGISIDGYRPAQGEDMEYPYNMVGPGWFETMGIPVLQGRGINASDRTGAPLAVVVNEAFARRFWPGQSPLGKRISTRGPSGPWHEVVGLVKDARYASLTESPRPYMYYSALQQPEGIVVHARTSGDPLALRDAVRREVQSVAPDWQVASIRTMESQLGVSLAPQRIAGTVLSLFGVIALLLAAVGLYGVVAYAVATRTREIGVRVALGASTGEVVRLVVRQGLRLALVGVLIGLPAGWAASRLLSSFLIGTSPTDVLSFAGAAVTLAVIAGLAAWIPARRAAAVHPMVALREE